MRARMCLCACVCVCELFVYGVDGGGMFIDARIADLVIIFFSGGIFHIYVHVVLLWHSACIYRSVCVFV